MSENKILATVNEKAIYESDLNELMQRLNPQQANQFNTKEGKEILLQELIGQELFYFDALEKKLDEDEEFKVEIEKIKENVLKSYAIRKELDSLEISEEEVKEYFEKNKLHFKAPEKIRASHILVDGEEKANEIKQEIDNGLSFEEAAEKYSKCPSKEKGGDLGEFQQGVMVPEFENKAFEMELNEISEPVETQFGFHLIKVVNRTDAKISSFEDVKSNLTAQLLAAKQTNYYKEKIDLLKEKYQVTINS
jgi:peptidyl-prolyl cis-trans isomerase C